MKTRFKFLSLIFAVFGGSALGLALFLHTEYAKNEMAYYREYPYRDMTSRLIKTPVVKIISIKKAEDITQDNPRILPPKKQKTAPRQIKKARTEVTNIVQVPTMARLLPKETEPQNPPRPFPQPPQKTPPRKPENNDARSGYNAYNKRNYKKAIFHFNRALDISPDNRALHLQLAYAHKKTGDNSAALENFKKAIDLYHDRAAPFSLRREVEQMDRNLTVSSYLIYREKSARNRQLGADLTQSQAGAEVSYQPKKNSFYNGQKFQIYARFLSGLKQNQLTPNPDSYQAAIGLRVKPLSRHNLVLSAERLIKAGNFSRNDWMLRIGYSRDHGTDYREDETHWWSYSLYLDATLIDPQSPDIILTSQVTGGYNIQLTEGLVLQPHLVALATWQKDSFREASLIEAGPGITIRYYFNDTKYQAYRARLDFTLEYRQKISGNSIGGAGPLIGLSLHF